jgi:hypothetical protein
MIEEQLADRMRAVLADEPPLGFDPDEVVDRAGRRRRSTFAVIGVTGAVLAVAVTAVVATSSGGGGPSVGTTPPTTTPRDAACQGVDPGHVPPLNFDGSAAIVARLDASAPGVIAAHLPGVSVRPSETGMVAYDCPPNVGTVYPVNGADQSVMLYLIHARGRLDLANDRYATDQAYRLTDETTAADGARIRTYEYNDGGILVVVRFDLDGMITEASVSGTGTLVADSAALQALASDPELRF